MDQAECWTFTSPTRYLQLRDEVLDDGDDRSTALRSNVCARKARSVKTTLSA
jgi:hypothetical protein